MKAKQIKRVLLTGATGLVGASLIETEPDKFIGLARKTVPWFPKNTPFKNCDIFDSAFDELPWAEMSAVVFLAFPTNVAEIEKYSLEKREKIVSSFKRFVDRAKSASLPILFFSSDAVLWDADPTERDVSAECKPSSIYGELKAACERMIRESEVNGNLILRATPVGFHKHDFRHGFLGKLVSAMMDNELVFGFSRNMITPVSLTRVTSFIFDWMKDPIGFVKKFGSTIHVTSRGAISKYDLLRFCAEKRNLGHLLKEKERVLDQTLIPSKGIEISLEETLLSVVQDLPPPRSLSSSREH